MNLFSRAISLAVLGCAFAGGVLTGCAPAPIPRGPYTILNGDPRGTSGSPDVSQSEWTLSRERLARMRADQPRKPYVERVRVGIVDPRSGKLYEARGAVAISPDHAARLILLGPGGTTAIDVWVTRERYRIAIPAMNLEKRGVAGAASERGLPIGMLRWWFLSPLGGELLLARSSKAEVAFLLRDDDATVSMRTDGQRFVAIRRQKEHLEGIEWVSRGLLPRAGARGRYIDGVWGVRVEVMIEEVLDHEPDPEAFADPDEKGTTL